MIFGGDAILTDQQLFGSFVDRYDGNGRLMVDPALPRLLSVGQLNIFFPYRKNFTGIRFDLVFHEGVGPFSVRLDDCQQVLFDFLFRQGAYEAFNESAFPEKQQGGNTANAIL